jgi:hypothetical protein
LLATAVLLVVVLLPLVVAAAAEFSCALCVALLAAASCPLGCAELTSDEVAGAEGACDGEEGACDGAEGACDGAESACDGAEGACDGAEGACDGAACVEVVVAAVVEEEGSFCTYLMASFFLGRGAARVRGAAVFLEVAGLAAMFLLRCG